MILPWPIAKATGAGLVADGIKDIVKSYSEENKKRR
jgi:hypothetical protein